MAYHDPPRIPVADPATQKALDGLHLALAELARDTRYRDVTVTLVDTVALVVRHGLGRAALGYALGAPTGATTSGRIVESARTSEGMTLTATGWGATITVPVRFW